MSATRSLLSLLLGLTAASFGSVARANTIDVKIEFYQFTGQHLTIQLGDSVPS